jgi:hypothetical protein
MISGTMRSRNMKDPAGVGCHRNWHLESVKRRQKEGSSAFTSS